jgi:hypothetical protein
MVMVEPTFTAWHGVVLTFNPSWHLNGGPATQVGKSNVAEGPPSVS